MTAPPIVTERLRLVPATVELVEFELSSPENLAVALGVGVPDDWPPGIHTDKVLEFTADTLRAARRLACGLRLAETRRHRQAEPR